MNNLINFLQTTDPITFMVCAAAILVVASMIIRLVYEIIFDK